MHGAFIFLHAWLACKTIFAVLQLCCSECLLNEDCGTGTYTEEVKRLWKKKKGERTVYLLSMLVHFQKLANLPSSWHADAPHMSISAVNQSSLTSWNYSQPLCIAFAGSYKHLCIDFTTIMHSIQHKDNNKPLALKNRGLPQLKSWRLRRTLSSQFDPSTLQSTTCDGKFAECLSVTISAVYLW